MEPGCTAELIALGIKEEHYYDRRHRSIFNLLCVMVSDGDPVDIVSFSSFTMTLGIQQEVGGIVYLSELMSAVTSTANLSYWAEVLKEKFQARMVIAKCTALVSMAYSRTDKVGDLLDRVERELVSLRTETVKRVSMKDVAREVIEAIEEAGEGRTPGLKTGLYKLDDLIGGLRDGELITVAARPGCGKSSLATTLLENVAIRNRWHSVIFSLEMSRKEIATRIMSSISGINLQSKIRGCQTLQDEHDAIVQAQITLGKAPLEIVAAPRMNISQLKAQARMFVETMGTKLFIVDYMQIVQASNPRDMRSQQVAEIARGLKETAFDLNVPILSLAQLNRESDKEERRPKLSDLKESGAIEEASNVVILLHPAADEKESDGVLPVNAYVAKSRDGATRSIQLGFRRTVTRFENYEGGFL